MDSLTFKDRLAEFVNAPERPVAQSGNLHVESLVKSLGELEESRPPKPPETLFREVIERALNGRLESVSRRDAVRVCSWYFSDILKLESSDQVTKELMNYAGKRGSTSLYKHLLLGVLGSLNKRAEALANIQVPIEGDLALVGRRWKEKVNQYGLLQKPYGENLAQQILSLEQKSARSKFIESSGLKQFRSSGLGVCVFGQLSKAVFRAFGSSDSDIEKYRVFDIWREYSCDKNSLRYTGQYSGPTAQVLLRPWANSEPSVELKNSVTDVLLESFGDPRTQKPRWAGIADEDINILRRWLAADSFDIFIRVISEIAKDKQWEQRKVFWSWYLENDQVRDVWVVCGTLASESLKRLDQNSTPSKRLKYAELKGARSDQSVLIMKIGNLTIAEWSHDGSVRFWKGQNNRKPDFYEIEYSGTELRSNSNNDIRHIGEWYSRVAVYIEQQTGVKRPRFDTLK